jgi:magnesium chelatase subunit D
LTADHLVFRTPQIKSGVRYIFVVDASGSHAARQRMAAVKGVVAALLETTVDHKDEVAVISFRGAKAGVVLQPCRDTSLALRTLEFLPTGGRTPLAHALELAGTLVTPSSLVILLTDGRANVPLKSGDPLSDPWADALAAAGNLKCTSLVVDSSVESSAGNAMEALASAMRAQLIRMGNLDKEVLVEMTLR